MDAATFQSRPTLITKKWLAGYFNITKGDGTYCNRRLYRLVLTDDVIEQIGLTPETVRCHGFKTFDAVASHKLAQVLNLQ